MGFAPFGTIRGNGMDVVDDIYPIQERPSQGQIQQAGNSYLDKNFPECSRIVSARVLGDNEL